MKRNLAGLAAGILFGLGLAVSQMISQKKVQDFLDLFGDWDPSLALVMAGAVAVTAILFRVVLKRGQPMFDTRFHLPQSTRVDARLLAGSAVFGVGWGLGGFCPGPGVASLSLGRIEPVIFVAALVAGSLVCKAVSRG